MPSPVTRRSYSVGHFQLALDLPGGYEPLFLKSVEGGFVKINASDVQAGSNPLRVKHETTREVEPITFEVGIAEGNQLMSWIKKSWDKQFARVDGHIVHMDYDYKIQFTHHFLGALIEEVSFPALDAASKDLMYLKVKIRPELVKLEMGEGAQVRGEGKPAQKLVPCAAFRLNLEKMSGPLLVNKIDGFTVKQGIKPVTFGRSKKELVPELEPTKIEFPDLKCTMSLAHAEPIFKWYEDVVVKGNTDGDSTETTGSIEFLSHDRKQVLGSIGLDGVGIKSFTIPKSDANASQIKRCTFELYVTKMNLLPDDFRMQL